jgi:hypothetical protein
MLGAVLIVVGAVLMVVGAVMLCGWIGGRSSWFNVGVYDRVGQSKTDRQFLHLYFIALVLAPLLCGAILIAFGLRRLC